MKNPGACVNTLASVLRALPEGRANRHLTVRELMQKRQEVYLASAIVAVFKEFRDTFDRAHSRVSVELTHGKWSTFAYVNRGLGDPIWREHASREAARDHARWWLS